MRTLQTSAGNHTSFRQTRLVVTLLITLALLVSLPTPFTVSATSAPTESTIVLETAGAPFLPGTTQAVHAEPGNETSPHVDCDIASYTFDDFMGRSTIHYQDLSTGIDTEVPGNAVDLLSDVSGSRVVFTEVTLSGDTVRVFDTASQTQTVVPGFGLSFPSIGGNLVAFEDRSSAVSSFDREITTYDLTTGIVTRLTNDSFDNRLVDVSPKGDAVVWEKCQPSNGLGCDVYTAIRTSPGVFTTRALTTAGGEDRSPSTNGELAVYVSNRTGDNDIYYQPLTGGTEVHLAIPGDQRLPNISGDLISFESAGQNGYDIFLYDTRSRQLFQVTSMLFSVQLNEISVCGDTGRIVYTKAGDGFDVYAFTFQVPSVPSDTEDQLTDLIALIRSFNLPSGIANSLMRKLQNALDAVNASDTATACNLLGAFINECQAQSGKKLTPAQSTQLITAANHIKTDLGCP